MIRLQGGASRNLVTNVTGRPAGRTIRRNSASASTLPTGPAVVNGAPYEPGLETDIKPPVTPTPAQLEAEKIQTALRKRKLEEEQDMTS